MLETLRIKDYALIDVIEAEFRPGLSVLTGETGAGKSIIVDALNLVLGARASADVVREGATRATVDAVFRIAKPSRRLAGLLKRCEVVLEDGELLLSRHVTTDGRSRAYAAGTLVPVSVLAEIGDELVDLHGQHEHQSLLKPDRQLDLLDAFADTESLATPVSDGVAQIRELDKGIAALQSDDRERARRAEFLRFEVAEIDAAGLDPSEEADLKTRRNLVTHAEKIVELTAHAYAALFESEGVSASQAIAAAARDLDDLVDIDPQFRPFAEQLQGVQALVEEVAADLHRFTDQADFDPQELERVNQRLALIGELKRKYGDSIETILAYRDKACEEIARFDHRDQHLAELETQRADLRRQTQETAERLSKKRRAAARKLDKLVTAALQDLGMKGGRFETAFADTELGSRGIERVEFLISANPGEKPKPLRLVASGGEISRIMLAIKCIFAETDSIPTLIFDEIDAGVGGATAKKVADKLRELAHSHQTLCITHIAQIAAAADNHYCVDKAAQKGRNVTTLARVEGKGRIEETARLLDGSVSEVSLRHARALLDGNG